MMISINRPVTPFVKYKFIPKSKIYDILDNGLILSSRLLVQLEETKNKFDEFWDSHERKLKQGLQLRKFEDDFKLVRCFLDLMNDFKMLFL